MKKLKIYLGLITILPSLVSATELVHRFQNPNFIGGNPLQGSYLMSQAAAQDKHKEPPVVEEPANALKDFTARLQESLLNEIANNASSKLFDADGNLIENNTVSIDKFAVSVGTRGVGGTLNINITDGITNTQLSIPRATSNSTTTGRTNTTGTTETTFIPVP